MIDYKINDDFKWKGFSFPESAKYQYFRSLELYIDDNNHGEKNILPHHTSTEAKKFMEEWKKFKQNPKDYYYKDVFFRREPYDL